MSSGSATIVGIMPCSNPRPTDGNSNSRLWAFDADIFLGYSEDGQPQSALSLLHFFLPSRTRPSNQERPFYVSGKLASMTPDLTSEGKRENNYDLFIEAFTVRFLCAVDVSSS